jgi:hypothetical protein
VTEAEQQLTADVGKPGEATDGIDTTQLVAYDRAGDKAAPSSMSVAAKVGLTAAASTLAVAAAYGASRCKSHWAEV